MKNFTLIHETPDHFVLHNGIAHFHVAKKGIDEPTADKIRSFANGGKTVAGDITQKENQKSMHKIDKKIATQNYDNGGDVKSQEQKESFHLDEPVQTDLSEVYKPTELPEQEKQPKRREIETEMPEPQAYAKGGKLDANARSHIAPHNFALPGGRYPIHNVAHARNALARVSQHGTEEEKAKVRSAVHSKYPGIEQSKADGGEVDDTSDTQTKQNDLSPGEEIQMYKHGKDVTSDYDRGQYKAMKQLQTESGLPMYDDGGAVDPSQTFQDSFRKATHYDDGGKVASPEVETAIETAASNPQNPTPPTPEEQDREARYAEIRRKNSENMTTGNYAQGGSIANETQSQAIKRYADGNPATLSKGGHVHNNGGKNQLHFHFYDGASIPTILDKEEGAGPQQPSALDKYVGGEPNPGPSSTPLDKYVKMAEGGDTPYMSDSDKLAAASQQVQQDTDAQNSTIANAAQDVTQQPAPTSATTVPAEEQISTVPKALSPTADQQPNMLSDFDKNLALEKQGIKQGAATQSKGYSDTAKAVGDMALQQKAQMDAYKIASDNLTAQNQHLFDSVASSKIDPNHFWNSKSTGGKIAASIGLLLGGIAGGLNGTNQNQAMAVLQNHIQQDIEAQKNDQSNKMNLYKMGLEKYKDQQSAQQFATLQSNALLQGQLQKIAAQTGSQQALATAKQMIGQLGVQSTNIRSELAMKQAAMSAMNSPQPVAGVDPNKMRLLINAGVIPKEEVPTAMKEFDDYGKLSGVLDHTDQVFKTASQNANYRERLSRAIPLGSHLPTVAEDSKKYEAVTNDWLGNITKETEGRVTPTDVDLMRPSLPQIGDSPAVRQTKINNIKDQIREKYSTFPTLQSYRLLHPNDPVAQSYSTRQKKFTESKPK